MRCRTCGFGQVPEGANFCPRCASLILRPLPIDYSGHVAERTVDFTGREWVFRAVDGWLGDPEAARILLLTGEPGCGKTAIAARLVQFSLDAEVPPDGITRLTPGFLSARHFCSGDHRWISPHRFSEAVSHQLGRYAEFSEALVESLRPRAGEGKAPAQVEIHQQIQHVSDQGMVIGSINIIERITVGDDVRPEDAFMRLVLEPLRALSPQEEGHKVVILVDALDEAVAYSGKANIVSLLAGATDLPDGVHFLLTCRNDSSLIGRFPGKDRLRIDISSKEHAEDAKGDIHAYLERRLSEPEIARRAAAAGPGDVLRQELIGKAEGNFLYVRFLLDEVAEGMRTLEDLEGVPRGLYGLYRTFLDRLNPEMREGRSSDAWRENYQPLLGCLSVAKEPVAADLVADWLDRSDGEVRALLDTELAQLRETDDGTDYRLYHRSMGEFLAASTYSENGATVPNLYYTPPYEGHGRIIRYYLDEFTDAWGDSDAYGLRYLVGHLGAGLDLARRPKQRRWAEEQLYTVVLDPAYRRAQRRSLGDLGITLADLSQALDLALEREDLVRILACAGAYRDAIRSQSMADAIFAAVDAGDLDTAHRRAELYSRTPDWARVLFLYLAWESVLRGDEATAQKAVARGLAQPVITTHELCDALVAHAARILSQRSADGRDAEAWFSRLHPSGDARHAVQRFGPAQPITPERRDELLGQLAERLRQLRYVAADDYGPEGTVQLIVLDDEERAYGIASLRDILVEAAADPEGQEKLAAALELILPNPYPQYRDIALDVLGVAVLAAADAPWVRQWLRPILQVGLDQEGVTFTLDLPSMLVAEAEGRGRAAPRLRAYLDTALDSDDRWGTSVRAHSARAAALFRLGKRDEALAALRHAAQLPTGFAGFATMTLLSLANRWLEFGRPDEASGDFNHLIEMAGMWAGKVNDYGLRMRREELVREYQTWLPEETPTFEHATAKLQATPDRGTRRTYKDHISARWVWPPDQPNLEVLKALVPWTVVDGTRLDSILGRLSGLLIRKLGMEGLSDEQLDEAIDICQRSLATGEPWRQEPVGPT
jgi:hypothetical protein